MTKYWCFINISLSGFYTVLSHINFCNKFLMKQKPIFTKIIRIYDDFKPIKSSISEMNNSDYVFNISKMNASMRFIEKCILQDEFRKTEFENEHGISEIVIIILIIFAWICSIIKFIKNFEMLSTTHYREIPYKMCQKDPANLGKIKICNDENECVIYASRDPVKSLSLTSLTASKNENICYLNGLSLRRSRFNHAISLQTGDMHQSSFKRFSSVKSSTNSISLVNNSYFRNIRDRSIIEVEL